MEAVRESWTDERMDDLKDQLVEQGRRVEVRFGSLEARFDSLEARVDARFESVQRTMIQLFAAAFAAFVGLISVQTALLLALL
jgi:hypothetical protein